jgi:hypothetical protein
VRSVAVVGLFLALLPAGAWAQVACSFENGFAVVAASLPDTVGTCTDGEHTEVDYPGWVVQPTTTGVMMWREVDGYTGFTNGDRIWRLEADGTIRGNPPPRPTPTPRPGSAAARRVACDAGQGYADLQQRLGRDVAGDCTGPATSDSGLIVQPTTRGWFWRGGPHAPPNFADPARTYTLRNDGRLTDFLNDDPRRPAGDICMPIGETTYCSQD